MALSFAAVRRQQRDVLHMHQLQQHGFSRAKIRWHLQVGRWNRVLPGVIALFSGALSREQQLIAASRYADDHAQIAGLTALELHSFRYAPRSKSVHVNVPTSRQRRSAKFVVISRTSRLDRWAWRNGTLLISSPARAVADAAHLIEDPNVVRAIVAEAVQRDHATVAQLQWELQAGKRNGSAHLRAALTEVADGTRSAPEALLRNALRGSSILGRIMWNPRLTGRDGERLPTPDGWLPEAALAIEVDSREFHTSPNDWRRSLDRHNQLGAHGVLVLHFTPNEIKNNPVAVRRTVEAAYRQRLGLDPCDVVVVPTTTTSHGSRKATS